MIQTYKIMNGIDRIKPTELYKFTEASITRGHSQKVTKPEFRLDRTKYSFSNRVVNNWNSLPEEIILSKTLNTFKTNIDKFWKKERYRPP